MSYTFRFLKWYVVQYTITHTIFNEKVDIANGIMSVGYCCQGTSHHLSVTTKDKWRKLGTFYDWCPKVKVIVRF